MQTRHYYAPVDSIEYMPVTEPVTVFCTFFKGKYGSTFFPAKIRCCFFDFFFFFFFFFCYGSEIYTHYLCYENMVRVFE